MSITHLLQKCTSLIKEDYAVSLEPRYAPSYLDFLKRTIDANSQFPSNLAGVHKRSPEMAYMRMFSSLLLLYSLYRGITPLFISPINTPKLITIRKGNGLEALRQDGLKPPRIPLYMREALPHALAIEDYHTFVSKSNQRARESRKLNISIPDSRGLLGLILGDEGIRKYLGKEIDLDYLMPRKPENIPWDNDRVDIVANNVTDRKSAERKVQSLNDAEILSLSRFLHRQNQRPIPIQILYASVNQAAKRLKKITKGDEHKVLMGNDRAELERQKDEIARMREIALVLPSMKDYFRDVKPTWDPILPYYIDGDLHIKLLAKKGDYGPRDIPPELEGMIDSSLGRAREFGCDIRAKIVMNPHEAEIKIIRNNGEEDIQTIAFMEALILSLKGRQGG